MSGDKGKYRSYYRIHRGAHPLETEEGKIRRETASQLKLCRAAGAALRGGVPGTERLSEAQDADVLDRVADLEHRAQRERRNAKVHKDRLKHLRRCGER